MKPCTQYIYKRFNVEDEKVWHPGQYREIGYVTTQIKTQGCW
jgi:hypothetical protein